jgi:hypothetical protein
MLAGISLSTTLFSFSLKTKLKLAWAVGMWANRQRSDGLSTYPSADELRLWVTASAVIHNERRSTTGILIQVNTGIRSARQFMRKTKTVYA